MLEFNHSPIKDLLINSDSNKQSSHRYGFIYELILNNLALKKQDELNILEIGVSQFGNASLFAWQNSDIIKRAVGIDIAPYKGELNQKSVFYKYDAYNEETVSQLKEIEGCIFDIIIHDGISRPKQQLFFLQNYLELLNDDGYLICEDVFDLKLLMAFLDDENSFVIDGWANRGKIVKSYKDPDFHQHTERILIKSKSQKLTDYKIHEYKKHIIKLPRFQCAEYERNSTELAVSVPLFYSDLDTHYKPFNAERFQQVHCKGAIWAGMSLIQNSDLMEKGVPLYFHIEDKAMEYAKPVFEQYNVPKEWIRLITAPAKNVTDIVNKTHFGKNYISLLDNNINADVLLILDSDIFTLCTDEKLKLYDRLTCSMLKKQPSMTYFALRSLNYSWWVSMALLVAGMPHELVKDHPLSELEIEAYKRLGFVKEPEININKNGTVQRFFSENYMMTFPKNHPSQKFAIKHIDKCHTAPYLFAIWAEYNQPFLQLHDILNIPIYDWENNFHIGKKGYNCFAHIRVNKSGRNSSLPSIVEMYWDNFYNNISRHITGI